MYKYWIILLLLSLGTETKAQLVGKSVLELPLKYARPTESVVRSPVEVGKSQFFNGRSWVVYVDSWGVKSYQNPRANKKETKFTLDYLDSFFVLEDSEKFLHIVKDENLKRGILSISVVDYGWVPKSQMLLWNTALKEVWATSSFRQGIISNQKTPGKRVKFYLHPALKKLNSPYLEPQSYFIYKLDPQNETVLLGSQERIDRRDPHLTFLGWTQQSNLIEKQSWLFCEPNWDPQVVNYRLENKQPLVAYRDSLAALHHALNSSIPKSPKLWIQDSIHHRRGGTWYRLPLLALHDEVARVAVYDPKTKTFRKAYLPIYIEGDSLRGVKLNLLLSRLELVNLMTKMEKLQLEMAPEDARFELKKILWKMAQPYLEPGVSMPVMSNWSFSRITQTIFGFPSQSELGKHRLKDFTDPEVVLEEEIIDFFVNLERKLVLLEDIFNARSYEASFRSEEETFFWIEEGLLP